MKNYIVSLDQGTTSSRCIIYNRDGEVIARSQTEITQIYPQKGWVEHDPMEIWATQIGVLNEALARENISPEDIDSIGITNQRETTIVWDKKTGRPIYNAIVWQCRRTADYCEVLKRTPMESVIREKTGLVIDAYFSASKIRWILDHIPGAQERAERGEILFGTVDSWLLFQLTKGKVHATDYTNASRTMLFNIKTLEWDQELLALFNIPRAMLPDTFESSHLFGETSIQGIRLPITAMVGDQQASIFGQQCFDKGDVKTTYGTGCFVLMNTHDHFVVSNHGLLTTITMAYNGKISYGLEGSVFNAGSVIQWLRDGLGLVDEAKDIEYFATKVQHNGGVVFVPALTGLGAPYWDMDATGALYGLTRGTNKNHILRAALESIALQCYDIIKAMEHDSQVEIKSLRVDGGASENHTLMQWQADLLNVQVQKGKHAESTALGACYLAGLKTGFFPSIEVIQEQHEWRFCWEREADQTTVNNLLTLWQAAIAKTLTKPES